MQENKNTKFWWYRLLIVIYVIAYLAIMALSIVAVVSSTKPYVSKYVDKELSYLQCKNDLNAVYYLDDNPRLSVFLFSNELDYLGKQEAENICNGNYYNMHFEVTEINHGSWFKLGGYLVLTILGIYIFMYLVSSAFNWIAFGEKFKKPFIISLFD